MILMTFKNILENLQDVKSSGFQIVYTRFSCFWMNHYIFTHSASEIFYDLTRNFIEIMILDC